MQYVLRTWEEVCREYINLLEISKTIIRPSDESGAFKFENADIRAHIRPILD